MRFFSCPGYRSPFWIISVLPGLWVFQARGTSVSFFLHSYPPDQKVQMGRKKVDFQEEESIAEEVRNYPCLYNKSLKEYKDKRARENAWQKIGESLGMKEGNNKIIIYSFLPKHISIRRRFLLKFYYTIQPVILGNRFLLLVLEDLVQN